MTHTMGDLPVTTLRADWTRVAVSVVLRLLHLRTGQHAKPCTQAPREWKAMNKLLERAGRSVCTVPTVPTVPRDLESGLLPVSARLLPPESGIWDQVILVFHSTG